jgi:hypothetical protein
MTIQPWPHAPLVKADKEFSPQHTRHRTVGKPDFSRPGPWTTVVWIRDAAVKETPVVLTFEEHASGGVNLHWLNEKLIYASVWWGRIVSTDFIFDVQSRKSIYGEMANYGGFIQPCSD